MTLVRPSPYAALGLRPVVNAAATLTRLGGSRLAPPAVTAMAEAAQCFVDLPELSARVGARIAELTGNEAGFVSSGAAAGITLAVAACVAGDDPLGLPAPGAEVVVFAAQRNGYDYSVRMTGARMVESGTEPVLTPGAACVLWYAGTHLASGAPALEDVVRAARAADVPVIVDAAAQVPPVSSLWHYTVELGADAVVFSGGKGLRGPQSSGLVLGSRRIVDGCAAHASPHHAIGRGMKVGKEELMGLLAAVEWTLGRDEDKLLGSYEASVNRWLEGLDGLPGIRRVERSFPSEAGQPHSRAIVRLGGQAGRDRLMAALWSYEPRIAVLPVDDDAIALNPQTLDPGEDLIVLDALRNLLAGPGPH